MKLCSLLVTTFLIITMIPFNTVLSPVIGGLNASNVIHVPRDYSSIQEAVNEASQGTTIIIEPGNYNENISIIEKQDLTIIGYTGNEKSIINGEFIIGNSTNIVIKNLVIQNSEYCGIYILNSSDITIINNTIQYNGRDGIIVRSSKNIVIGMSKIQNNTLDGVFIENSELVRISYNFIINNTQDGIDLRDSNKVTIVSNKIKYHRRRDGVYVVNSYRIDVHENNIMHNFYNGVELYGSYNVSIIDNEISNNSWEGLFIRRSRYVSILNNDIYDTGRNSGLPYPDGIDIRYSSFISIVRNKIRLNKWDGIYILGLDHVLIYNNKIMFNNDNGIDIRKSSGVFVFLDLILDSIYINNSNVQWYSPSPIQYMYNGITHTGYIGNCWKDYSGPDNDGDGIIDQPYDTGYGLDSYPLTNVPSKYMVLRFNSSLWGVSVSTLWDPGKDTYSFKNPGVPWSEDGVCYGMASTEILYFMRYTLGKTDYPVFPSKTATETRELYVNTNKFKEGVLNNVSFAIILHQLYAQPIFNNIKLILGKVDLEEEFNKLTEYLNDEEPVILILGPNNLHAVVAWRIDEGMDERYYIYVSDPNHPGVIKYAIYDPIQRVFRYTGSSKYYWDLFIVVEAKPLHYYNFLFMPSISPLINIRLNPYFDNYWLIVSTINIKLKDPLNLDRTSYFTIFGNSQSFQTSIPGAVGISENDFIAFAIPKKIIPIIDPSANYSSITILWSDDQNGQPALYGYTINITSSIPTHYALVPFNNGFNVSAINTSITVNITVYRHTVNDTYILNAYNILVNNMSTAYFTILDWSNLNSTTTPSIKLTLVNTSTNEVLGITNIHNGETNIRILRTTPNRVLPASQSTIIPVIMLVATLILIFLKRKRQ